MKKRIFIWIFIVIFILTLHFTSGFLHERAEGWLRGKLISMLPEGSSVGTMNWEVFSSLKADSVNIPGLGRLSEIEIFYSPLRLIVKREIKNVTIYEPEIEITPSDSAEKGPEFEALFYIKEVSIIRGKVSVENYDVNFTARGKVFSHEGEIDIDILDLAGNMDDFKFKLKDGELVLKDGGTGLNFDKVKFGKSELKLRGNLNKTIKGEAKINLEDIEKLWGVDATGVVNVHFTRDSIFKFEGWSSKSSIEGFSVPILSFNGTEDSINVNGDKLYGYILINDSIKSRFNFSELNFNSLKDDLPSTELSGEFKIGYSNKNNFSFHSNIEGEFKENILKEVNISFRKKKDRYFFNEISGYLNEGYLYFRGEFNEEFRDIKGELEIKELNTSDIKEYLPEKIMAVVSADVIIDDEIRGSFSINDISYKTFNMDMIEGNVDCMQKKEGIDGDIIFVGQGMKIMKNEIFSIGKGKINLDGKLLNISGLFKDRSKALEFSVSYGKNRLIVDTLSIDAPDGGMYIEDSFSLTFDEGGMEGRGLFKAKNRGFLSVDIEKDIINIEVGDFALKNLRWTRLYPPEITGIIDCKIEIPTGKKIDEISITGSGIIEWMGDKIDDSLSYKLRYRSKNLYMDRVKIYNDGEYSEFSGIYDTRRNSVNIKTDIKGAGPWLFYPASDYVEVDDAEVNGSLRIRGELPYPEVYGELTLSNGEMLILKTGLQVDDLKAEIKCEGRKIFLESSNISLQEGSIEAAGFFDMSNRSYSFDLEVEKAPINWENVNALTDAEIVVQKDEYIKIEGEVDLNQATITMPFRRESEERRKLQNLYLKLDIDASGGNVWLRNETVDLELEGKVGLMYDRGTLLLRGGLSVKNGVIYYLYRTFDIVKGEFKFNNTPELNPVIDLKANTIVTKEDTIYLDVSGSMRSPQFELYSRPARSTADIIALLNLNLSWEEISSMESIEESVTETAFNYWIRQTFTRKFKERFGIDVVKMYGEAGRYELVLGKYITDKLFIKARTDILSYGISEVKAEYRIKKWLSVTAEDTETGDTRLLMNMKWRY